MSSEEFVVTPGGPAVDADNPWPGLSAFTEDLEAYFCGRIEETEDLFRRVKRKPLTTLFGMSGPALLRWPNILAGLSDIHSRHFKAERGVHEVRDQAETNGGAIGHSPSL